MDFAEQFLAPPLDPPNASHIRSFQRDGSDDFFMLQELHLVGGESQHFFQDQVVVLAETGRRFVSRLWLVGALPERAAEEVGSSVGMHDCLEVISFLEMGIVIGVAIAVENRSDR